MPDGLPSITFRQPFFQDEILATSVERMRRSITSVTTLEAAYRNASAEARERGITTSREAAEEALALYNKVVQDGRYIRELTTDPARVAEELGVELSSEAESLLREAGTLAILLPPDPYDGPGPDIPVLVVAILMLVHIPLPDLHLVVDQSGLVKL